MCNVPFDSDRQQMKMLSHAGHMITPYHDAPYYDIGDIHTGNNSMYREMLDTRYTDNIKKWPSSAMEFECAELKILLEQLIMQVVMPKVQ